MKPVKKFKYISINIKEILEDFHKIVLDTLSNYQIPPNTQFKVIGHSLGGALSVAYVNNLGGYLKNNDQYKPNKAITINPIGIKYYLAGRSGNA